MQLVHTYMNQIKDVSFHVSTPAAGHRFHSGI